MKNGAFQNALSWNTLFENGCFSKRWLQLPLAIDSVHEGKVTLNCEFCDKNLLRKNNLSKRIASVHEGNTLSYDNFKLKIKNMFPIFGYMMHICQTNNFWFGGLSKSFVLFCKSSWSKMASVKTNKNKNRTPLLKTNFLWLETLHLGPKRFLYSKGPKNSICLWLRLGKLNGSKQSRFDFV